MNALTPPRGREGLVDASTVVDAARYLFTRHGFAVASVRDIAFRAGVSVGSVNNVGDKGSLFLMAMAHISPDRRLLEAVGDLSGSSDTFPAKLADVLGEELDRAAKEGETVRQFASLRLERGLDASTERDVSDLVVVVARKLCRRWECKMPDDDALAAAWAIQTGFSATWQAIVAGSAHPDVWRRYLRDHVLQHCERPRNGSAAKKA